MNELRWVLLLLGAIVIGAVWLVGSGRVPALFSRRQRSQEAPPSPKRQEPKLDEDAPAPWSKDEPAENAAVDGSEKTVAEPIDRVVTVRFVPRKKALNAEETLLALRSAGLRLGQYGVFHMYGDETMRDTLFMVANLTEPGSFDLSNLSESTIPGMNFFLVLPGVGDPVERFDKMVDTARTLARALDAELRDERGSSWSIQRERYVREEIIAYRHHAEGREGE